MDEVKKCYQNIKVKPVDPVNGVFAVENDYFFRNLNDFDCFYEVFSNEKTMMQGKIDLNCAPGKSQEIMIMLPESIFFTDKPNMEFFVNFSFRIKKGNDLLKDGYEVAYAPIKLSSSTMATEATRPEPSIPKIFILYLLYRDFAVVESLF